MTPRVVLGVLLRTLVGLFLLAAGLMKLADPGEFFYEMTTYKVVGPAVAAFAAPALIAFEIALAVALLAGLWPRLTAGLTCLLFLGFIGVVWRGVVIGRTGGCGCFGTYVQRTPMEAIAEDAAAIAATLLAAWLLRARPGIAGRPAAAIGGAVGAAALLLAIASPRLPIDRYVTSLNVGRSLTDLKLAGRVPGLESGRRLVALLDVTRPESVGAAAALNDLAGRPGAPGVIALTPSSEEEVAAFMWTAVPAFEIKSIERSTLKPLYRRLPRYVLLNDGVVVSIFDGAPPQAKDLLSSEPS